MLGAKDVEGRTDTLAVLPELTVQHKQGKLQSSSTPREVPSGARRKPRTAAALRGLSKERGAAGRAPGHAAG